MPSLRMGGAVPLIPLYTIMTPTGKILLYFSCPAFYASVLIFSVFNFQMYSAWYRAKCHIPWRRIGVCPSESCTCRYGDPGVCWKDKCSKARSFKTTTNTKELAYSILYLACSLVSGYINCKFWMTNFLHALKRNETYIEGVTRQGTCDVISSFSVVNSNQVKAVMVG